MGGSGLPTACKCRDVVVLLTRLLWDARCSGTLIPASCVFYVTNQLGFDVGTALSHGTASRQACSLPVHRVRCGAQMASALGEAGSLMALRCQPAEALPPVALPPHLRLWGVDSGIRHRCFQPQIVQGLAGY